MADAAHVVKYPKTFKIILPGRGVRGLYFHVYLDNDIFNLLDTFGGFEKGELLRIRQGRQESKIID